MAILKEFNLADLREDVAVPKPVWVEEIKSLPQSMRDNIIVSYDSTGVPRSWFRDDQWYMAGHFLVNTTTTTTLDFTRLHKEFREAVKVYIWEHMYAKGKPKALRTLNNNIDSMSSVSLLIQAVGGSGWEYLESEEHYQKWLAEIGCRKYSSATLEQYFAAVNRFHQYGLIGRSISEVKKLAKELGQPSKQTICLPEEIAIPLYSQALSIVKEWHPYADAIKNASADLFEAMNDKKLWKARESKEKTKFQKQLKEKHGVPSNFALNGLWGGHSWLAGMCYLVIAGFTGMRYNEIASATELAYHEKQVDDNNVIPYVHSVVTKTNDGVPLEADWVTIPDVKLALELWRTIFEPHRKICRKNLEASDYDADMKKKLLSEINGLCVPPRLVRMKKKPSFVWSSGNIGERINNEISALVKSFEKENKGKKSPLRLNEKTLAEFNVANEDYVGEYKEDDVIHYSTHMSRRTLAVFVLRNRLGSLIDLKHQFKHLNVYMTQWYTNGSMHVAFMDMMMDPEFQDELREMHVDIQTDIILEFYNDDVLGGKKGKSIMAEREQNDGYIEGEGKIYITRAEVKKRIETGILSVVDLPFGYCTNATCSRICNSEQSTVTCTNEVITLNKAKKLIPHYELLIRKFERRNSSNRYMPSILHKDRMDIIALQKTFNDLGIEHRAYEPIINNINQSIVMSA
ncbi:hypothetical protein C942_04671 [Photobacterium marinum]|uniref:Integrase n=1 Tax=Photobacterium marinum TaxID=1056511 RepID=L8JHN6_9GAMM|nr:hypothetical protein [Photobacterium marinum]ELR66967.1 hypothetical protein C942_04671 [Photobacterium marinum]